MCIWINVSTIQWPQVREINWKLKWTNEYSISVQRAQIIKFYEGIKNWKSDTEFNLKIEIKCWDPSLSFKILSKVNTEYDVLCSKLVVGGIQNTHLLNFKLEENQLDQTYMYSLHAPITTSRVIAAFQLSINQSADWHDPILLLVHKARFHYPWG